MFKSFAIFAVFATGATVPAVQDVQPVKGATLSIAQISLDWSADGFEATVAEEADFALKIKLIGDKAVTLKF